MPLPPLAWMLHEPAVVTLDTDTIHRWGCKRMDELARPVAKREILWRGIL